MATAAAVSYVNSMDFMKEMTTGPNGLPVKFADLEFTQKLGVSITNAATGAVTRTALNGGSLGDALVQSIGNGLTTALAAQGANALHLSPDQQGDLMAQVGNKLGHALIGCAAAKANSAGNNCQAGAMGAVIGEIAAELLANKDPSQMTAQEQQTLVNTSKLLSASIAAVAGLDPNTAAAAATNAVENNLLKMRDKPFTWAKAAKNVQPYLDDEVEARLDKWEALAKERGVDLQFMEAFRTTQTQKGLQSDKNATTPAKAGTSLHEAGTAFDVVYRNLPPEQQRIIVEAAKEAGFKWGGDFKPVPGQRIDDVHFYIDLGDKKIRIEDAQKTFCELSKKC
jgi:LAS superfamily LD-carboxypeptidase LdcB